MLLKLGQSMFLSFFVVIILYRQLHVSNGRRLPTAYKQRYSSTPTVTTAPTTPLPSPVVIVVPTDAPTDPTRPVFDMPCQDLRKDCFLWAAAQGCVEDPVYMHAHCPASCQVCHQRWSFHFDSSNENTASSSSSYSALETIITADKIYDAVGRHLGVPQIIEDDDREPETERAARNRVEQADDYILDVVNVESRFLPVRGRCRNLDDYCAFWAVQGDCEDNEAFMVESCAPVCFACEYLHVESQCPIDTSEKNALYPGDLSRMFENIIRNEYYKNRYDIQVLSRPSLPEHDVLDGDESTTSPVDGPWIVILDNFINATEAQTLIDLGATIGYNRSTDVGDIEEDGSFGEVVSHSRTSTNAWCSTIDCLSDPVVVAVRERMENLTAIPMANSEDLQLLRYVPGQKYDVHHDYISYEVSRRQGVRILTIFLYLNEVEKGGHTDFPQLHLSVTPKLGRALIWPSVLDEFPNKVDQRTEHRANRVMAGIKYGANAWIHQRAILKDCF